MNTPKMEIVQSDRQQLTPAPRWKSGQEPDQSLPFGGLYASSYGYDARAAWQSYWDEAFERWLTSGNRRSDHTRRTYRIAVMQFAQFVRVKYGMAHLWQVTDYHVQGWVTAMNDDGKSKRTVAARLAACSSFFDYCASTIGMINGAEVSLFVDAYGSSRQNPFLARTVDRPKVEQFSDVVQVPPEAYQWIIADLQQRNEERPCLENVRNLALMLMFGLNGWRNQEVISMTWGKVADNTQRDGQYTYRWTGKARDGAEERRPLPAAVYNAIVAYLKFGGRWNPGGDGHIEDGDYIWQPVRTLGCVNFHNVDGLGRNRHITQSTCNGILQALLRRYYRQTAKKAGMNRQAAAAYADKKARGYSIHSLRHMFAWGLYEASGHDIHKVSSKLGHKSIATTQTYLQHLSEPIDDHSELLARQFGLKL